MAEASAIIMQCIRDARVPDEGTTFRSKRPTVFGVASLQDFAYYVNSNEIAYLVGRQTDKPQAEGDSKWKFAEANFHWGRNGRKNEGSEHYLEGVQVSGAWTTRAIS